LKKIIVICFIFMALVSIMSVSAEGNITETQQSDLVDLNASVYIPEEMPHSETLNINNFDIKIDSPDDYNETVSIFVDESLIKETNVKSKNNVLYPFEYDVGNHTLRVNFPQSSIYKELNLTRNFSIVETQTSINNVSNQVFVHVVTASDVTGDVRVYVNGTQMKKANLENIFDRASGYSAQLSDLNPGTYEITVIYSGDNKYKRFVKSKIVTVNYDIDLGSNDYDYFESKIIYISLPYNIQNKKISVVIDGKNYPAKYDGENEIFKVDAGDLSIGEHPISITYNGDSIFPKQTVYDTLKVTSHIRYSSTIIYGENVTVGLKLPEGYTGNLSLYISKNYSETPAPEDLCEIAPLVGGVANITVPVLDVGRYRFNILFDGSKHVDNVSASVDVFPKLTCPSVVNGREATIYAYANDDANGLIECWILNDEVGEFSVSFNIVNGRGNYTLKNLPLQKLDITPEYTSNDLKLYGSTFKMDVKGYTPVLSDNKDVNMYYGDGSVFSVKVKDKISKYRSGNEVTFKIGSKTYYANTNSKGVAKLKISQKPGKYKITAIYGGVSVSNKIVVKEMLSLSTVKVKKSAKTLVLKAKLAKKLKGKKITFKFNGKKYTTKTDKKGVAKVTINKNVLKKLKVGKKITYQATYLKDTVKKTVKVKK